jgi:hypothetical protein
LLLILALLDHLSNADHERLSWFALESSGSVSDNDAKTDIQNLLRKLVRSNGPTAFASFYGLLPAAAQRNLLITFTSLFYQSSSYVVRTIAR